MLALEDFIYDYSLVPCEVESIKRFRWELMAVPSKLQGGREIAPKYSWVAVAFSSDKRLGKDLVFPCTNDPSGSEVAFCLSIIRNRNIVFS